MGHHRGSVPLVLIGRRICAISGTQGRALELDSANMGYEFTEWPREPEPQAASGRSGGPPRKSIGIDVLDPFVPPKKPLGPIPGIPKSLLLRIFAGIILVTLAVMLVLIFFGR